nr:MAG TPA: hypothetical protein [Caudoviricetes sp.]
MLPYTVAGQFIIGRNLGISVQVIRWRNFPLGRKPGKNVIV